MTEANAPLSRLVVRLPTRLLDLMRTESQRTSTPLAVLIRQALIARFEPSSVSWRQRGGGCKPPLDPPGWHYEPHAISPLTAPSGDPFHRKSDRR
jgi:hypothetical protein